MRGWTSAISLSADDPHDRLEQSPEPDKEVQDGNERHRDHERENAAQKTQIRNRETAWRFADSVDEIVLVYPDQDINNPGVDTDH